jgi:hypothetical protein
MTEYWVSQSKHFCKYCNCWITDNKASRQFHETSAKHKFSLQRFNKEKREKALHGAHSEQDLRQTLYEIDKAARSAISADRAANSSSGGSSGSNSFYANASIRPTAATSLVAQSNIVLRPYSGAGNKDGPSSSSSSGGAAYGSARERRDEGGISKIELDRCVLDF